MLVYYLETFVSLLFNILTLAILARVLLSWFQLSPTNPLIAILNEITEPILAPLRRVIPPLGMIDITPIVAMILLNVLQNAVMWSLAGL
jgi:YggT family protein